MVKDAQENSSTETKNFCKEPTPTKNLQKHPKTIRSQNQPKTDPKYPKLSKNNPKSPPKTIHRTTQKHPKPYQPSSPPPKSNTFKKHNTHNTTNHPFTSCAKALRSRLQSGWRQRVRHLTSRRHRRQRSLGFGQRIFIGHLRALTCLTRGFDSF